MLDALNNPISQGIDYAFSFKTGGVRATLIGKVVPISDTHVKMSVDNMICFDIDGKVYENVPWKVRVPPSTVSTVLFPVSFRIGN